MVLQKLFYPSRPTPRCLRHRGVHFKPREFEGEKWFVKTAFLPQDTSSPRRRRGEVCFLKLKNLTIFSLLKFETNVVYTLFIYQKN
jgi:hypothetical protein